MAAETSSQSTPSKRATASDDPPLLPTEESSKESATDATPGFGWNRYAEQTNGRFAMVGFILLLVLELFTRQDFFTWIGLPLGSYAC